MLYSSSSVGGKTLLSPSTSFLPLLRLVELSDDQAGDVGNRTVVNNLTVKEDIRGEVA